MFYAGWEADLGPNPRLLVGVRAGIGAWKHLCSLHFVHDHDHIMGSQTRLRRKRVRGLLRWLFSCEGGKRIIEACPVIIRATSL